MTFDYDYFVIGAGSGGVRSARIAAAHGARVAIAEEYRVGGTCVIRGCVPKKMLVIGADFAGNLARAEKFGWNISAKSFDWRALRDNVLGNVDYLNQLYQRNLDNHKVDTLHAHARLVGPNRVQVDDREITARHVLIATGARPFVPRIPGAAHGITSNEFFHLDNLPRRAVIIGGGYIAVEFAGILHELGCDVSLVLRSDVLLRGWDRSLADHLLDIMQKRGIRFIFNANVAQLDKADDGTLTAHFDHGAPAACDLLLWATGRVPNVENLGLDTVGIDTADNGAIPVDDASHTKLPWLHAVGDVTDRIQLTPVAIREGHALADTLFGDNPRQVDHSCVPSAVFSHPPLASVGLTETEARARFADVRIFRSDFRPMANSLAGSSERCLYKLVVDGETDRLLGAHLIGPEAPEILQVFAIAVKAGLTKAQIDETVALHPTMAEELVLMRA